MFRIRKYARCITILLATLAAIEPGLGRTTPPAFATSATSASTQRPSVATDRSNAPQTTDSVQSYLQLTLDLAVGQTVAGTGLKVIALNSQLDNTGTPSGQSVSTGGNGNWHVELQDAGGQPLALDGTLNYEIQGDAQNSSQGNMTLNISGSLEGDNAKVDVDAAESGQVEDPRWNVTGNFDSVLTRGSAKSHTLIHRESNTSQIGNDLSRTVSSSYVTRDDRKSGWTQTAIVREYGSGEQEVWLERVVDGPDASTGPLTINQHYFERLVNDKASQYLDRFDMQVAGDTFSLSAPTEISFASDGSTGYSFDLTDSRGEAIKLNSPSKPQSSLAPSSTDRPVSKEGSPKAIAGLASPLVAYSTSGPPVPDLAVPISRQGVEDVGDAGDVGDAANVDNIGRLPILFAPTAGACSTSANFVFGVALGLALAALASILAPELFAIGAAAEGATIGEVLGVVGQEMLEQLVQAVIQAIGDWLKSRIGSNVVDKKGMKDLIDFWSNLLQILSSFLTGATPQNLVGAVANGYQAVLPDVGAAFCNADPYFVYGDVRPSDDPVNPSPVQITRVTGGLADTSTFSLIMTTTDTPTAVLTPAGSEIVSPTVGTIGGASAATYNDSPNIFVGGSLPKGATPIGTWSWDPSRPYGAIPSHTQPPSKGAQIHYFIHASDPYTVTASDNLIQYVYLDPQNPPSELYLQFYTGDGNGEQRAYWGANLAQTGGQAGTATLYPMGPLPTTGGWARLQVPASDLGLTGKPINGVLYGAYGGQTWWGPTTASDEQTDNAPDGMSVQAPPAPLTWTVGSQIAVRLAAPVEVSADIIDAKGAHVRTLLKDASAQTDYQVITWDAKNDAGAQMPDVPYRVQFRVGGKVVSEHGVTISPLVANIRTPGAFSLVRGAQVPVVGEAHGSLFDSYTLAYGQGLNPSTWITITTSESPALPAPVSSLKQSNPSNLASWNTGLDEFAPWNQPGLSGVYTLRLSVLGKDGRGADDTFPVIVGRLAQTSEGGTITSPDGQASLSVPAFATQDSFSLLALVPLSQTESVGDWHHLLPTNEQVAGKVYEVFPADEHFRQLVTLQLTYDGDSTSGPSKVGIMMGDGTPSGWHYIGGQIDSGKHTISAQLKDFGGKRALVAPFVSDNFGPVPGPPGPTAQLSFTDTRAAPSVTAGNSQVGYYSDFQTGAGEWASLDLGGTQLSRVTGADAGLSGDDAALKVTKLAGGGRTVSALTAPYDAARYPVISFDYRVSPDYAPDLLVKCDGTWWQFRIGTEGSASATAHTRYFQTLASPTLTADNAWHHYQLDLLGWLRFADPTATSFQVDQVVFGQVDMVDYLQYVLVDKGAPGDSYYLDNFALLNPTSAISYNLTFAQPQGMAFSAYSYSLDRKEETVPPETTQTTAPAAKVDLPDGSADAGGDGGMWYLHIRGQRTDGSWSETGLYPLLVDRQAPIVGRPDPPPGGTGAPDLITLPIQDDSGLSLASVQLRFAGNTYSAGPSNGGMSYDPEAHALEIRYNALNPRPPVFRDGQKVEVTLEEAEDYAGNRMTVPFTWTFTADSPRQANQPDFHQLTISGGEQPALSPDGSTLAFVSSRSGGPRVWLMSATDYGEKGGSANPLLGNKDKANEADPAWSPDGTKLAYVSDAGSSQQIWTAGADGSGAKALTTGDGGATSPTWLSDGKTVVFVRDGNLWRVTSDGTGLANMTNDPDKAVRSVQAQPGGDLLAVGYKLYQQTIKLYDPATKEWRSLTEGGAETEPAWLDANTVLYTAAQPQAGGQSAIWQARLSESGASVMQGSGVPGTADMEPDAANASSGAQELAITSTRAGDRNVWVRQALRISRLEAQPSAGAPSGGVFTILYSLPTTSTVSLHVLDATGASAITLVDGASQSPGAHQATWEGKDAKGKLLAPGDYVVELSAVLPSGDTLTRRADARVLDPASVGTLQLEIDQWPEQPLSQRLSSFYTLVFAQGNRTAPIAKGDVGDNHPQFRLSAGQYDVQVEHDGDYTMMQGVSVEGSKTVTATVDLGLGGLEVSVLTAPGQPATGNTSIQVTRSGDASNTTVNTEYNPVSDFVLTPGKYNVKVDYQGVEKHAYGVRVTTGKVTKQDIDLGSGLINLTVDEEDGKLIQGGPGQVSVAAYPTGDHTQSLDTEYADPAHLRLPAGRYDLKVTYRTVDPGNEDNSLMSGSITNWISDVQVDSGQTVNQDYNLRLTPVTVTLEEAHGKPLVQTAADVGKLTLGIYPTGVDTDYVGLSYTNTLRLLLPEGRFDVLADYVDTSLKTDGPVGSLDVHYGQNVNKIIDLSLGHLVVTVKDEAGQLINSGDVSAYAYPVGAPGKAFSQAFSAPALDLPLRSGVKYNVEVDLNTTNKHLTLTGQQVTEGETERVQVTIKDFK